MLEDFFDFSRPIALASVGIFAASCIHVFARALQTLNITNKHWRGVLPTSMLIAFSEAFVVIAVVATQNLWVLIFWGFGGATGCWSAMALHTVLTKKSGANNSNLAGARNIGNLRQ